MAEACVRRIVFEFMDQSNHRVASSLPITAKPGKHFTAESIEAAAKAVKDKLDARSPGHRYRMVRLGAGRFRFVWGSDLSKSA
jgi:hypothetical protein